MFSKLVILALSLLLIAAVGITLLSLRDKDYYINLEIGTSRTSPTPWMAQQPPEQTGSNEDQEMVAAPSAGPHDSGAIDQQITIPIKDADDQEIAEIDYKLAEYELTNEIIVQGRKATAIEGREFLIIILEITHNYENVIQINSKDYIRLSIDGGEWLSPDIHNDPVEIQPNSTKYTRVGFPINVSDDNFSIRLGEIDGEELIFEL